MKNIISMIILMIALFVNMASGNQPTASSCHPELVSSHPELVSGPSDLASASYPETTISATASSIIQATVGDVEPVEKGNFLTRNWGVLVMGLLGFADLVTRLTPTEKDNSIVNFLVSVFNTIIPNLKKGGGRL